MVCKKCKAENPDDNKFCSSCGAALKEETKEVTENKADTEKKDEKPSYYPYRQNVNTEPRAFGITSWIFTGLLIAKSFAMVVTILVIFLSGGSQSVDNAIAVMLGLLTWTSAGSILGYVLTGFEILFAIIFAILQFVKNKSKFSKICLVFAITMAVVTIALMVVYRASVTSIFS